jgi:hypothetical protein
MKKYGTIGAACLAVALAAASPALARGGGGGHGGGGVRQRGVFGGQIGLVSLGFPWEYGPILRFEDFL